MNAQPKLDLPKFGLIRILSRNYVYYYPNDCFALLPSMNKGDDWIILSFICEDFKHWIIDGRTITIIVRPLSDLYKQDSIEAYVSYASEEFSFAPYHWNFN